MKYHNLILFAVMGLMLSACTQTKYVAHVAKQVTLPQDPPPRSKGFFKVGSSYKIKGKRYYPAQSYNLVETGTASWYGPGFHGKQTANGEIFDQNELTAAHRTLQLPSIVKVTNLENGRSTILRVNDRGPFAHERILDVSERASTVLGFKNKGVARIRLEVLEEASREVAALAKSGKSTRGYEVAYANGDRSQYAQVPPTPLYKPDPVTQVVFEGQPSTAAAPEPVQTASIPAVQTVPLNDILKQAANPNASYIQNSAKVFVQAGSFSQESNAFNFSNTLSQYGNSQVFKTYIDDNAYYRVRLGPYDDAMQAQQIVTSLNQNGNQNAVIVTD